MMVKEMDTPPPPSRKGIDGGLHHPAGQNHSQEAYVFPMHAVVLLFLQSIPGMPDREGEKEGFYGAGTILILKT